MSLYKDIAFLSTADLLALPPMEYLIDGIIPKDSLVCLYGAPENGKSFVALDWAMCISEGMPWLGRVPTKRGPVIYIAAEGGRGIQKRVRAWMQYHQKTSLPAMYWLLEPLYVREEGVVEAFVEHLIELDVYPHLIVLDTLSRSFGGGEENSSEDMGHFITRITQLSQERRMACLVIHHSNAAKTKARGHTSFEGALDASFVAEATREDNGNIVLMTVSPAKMKDDARPEPFYLKPVEGNYGSLVFEETTAPDKPAKGPAEEKPMRVVDMLRVLGAAEDGYTFTEWRLATNIAKSTCNKRISKLLKKGVIYREGAKFYVTPSTTDLADLDEDDE